MAPSKLSTLPLLAPHEATLEKCVYCPKLCRAACPVGLVDGSEAVSPWGKMSMAYFQGRGDVPTDEAHSEPAWACTGCMACRTWCDHDNPVADVLLDTRAAAHARGAAPPAAKAVSDGFAARSAAYAALVEEVAEGTDASARTAFVLGGGYGAATKAEAAAAWRVARRVVEGPLRAATKLSGRALLEAGDRAGFTTAAAALCAELAGAEQVVVVDPGCARALLHELPRLGKEAPPVVLLVDLVYARVADLPHSVFAGAAWRYHDPCHLGRGLGRYEEPRAILARLSGAPPQDLPRHREHGECSGAGGLLPLTRPDDSRAIADARIAEHEGAGGGTLITACASSLRRLRGRGAEVKDLYALIDEALSAAPSEA